MCQCTDADAVYAGAADIGDIFQSYAAGGFQQRFAAAAQFVTQGDGLGEHCRGHVVEKNDVGSAAGEGFFELVKVVNFEP